MNACDIVAWHFDGAVYCDGCVEDAHKEPEYYEGWGGPVFADDEHVLDMCCDTCGHSIGCVVGIHDASCFPCDVTVSTEAASVLVKGLREASDELRGYLGALPAGVRRNVMTNLRNGDRP